MRHNPLLLALSALSALALLTACSGIERRPSDDDDVTDPADPTDPSDPSDPADPGTLPSKPGDPPALCVPEDVQLTHGVSIAVDDSSLFIADYGSGEQDGRIVRVDKTCTKGEVIAADLDRPGYVTVHGEHVYWSNPTGLTRAAKDGSGAELLASGNGWGKVAFDSSYLYYADGSGITRIALNGGAAETIVSTGCGTDSVVLDDTHLYIAQGGCAGDILRAPKDGGPVEVIAVSQHSNSVLVDDTHVYWVRDSYGAVTVWPKSGGDGRVLPGVAHKPSVLAQTDDRLFFPGLYDIGSYLKAGSSQWYVNVEASAIALDTDRIYRVAGSELGAIAYPGPESPTGFASGSGSVTIEWIANCYQDSLIGVFLQGPTRYNTSVDCNSGSYTFSGLEAGQYSFIMEHPDDSIGFSSYEFNVGGGNITIGPIELYFD